MSEQQFKLYRPFEDKVSRVTSIHQAFNRLDQNRWGEPKTGRQIQVKVFHSLADVPSDKIFFLAGEEEIHLEIHHNHDLYHQLRNLVNTALINQEFTRYSLARFIVEHGFDIAY